MFKLLAAYLDELGPEKHHHAALDPSLVEKLKGFIHGKFNSKSSKLVSRNFNHGCTMDQRCTSFGESQNRVIKSSSVGPTPHDSIDVAGTQLTQVIEEQNSTKARKSAQSLSGTFTSAEKSESSVCGVSDWCSGELERESLASANYAVMLLRRSECLQELEIKVKHRKW